MRRVAGRLVAVIHVLHVAADPVVEGRRAAGVAVRGGQRAGNGRAIGELLVRGRGNRLARRIVPGLGLLEDRVVAVEGEVKGTGAYNGWSGKSS